MSKSRGYIYIISFDNTTDIYIGKTIQDISKRLYDHLHYPKSIVYEYMKLNNFTNDIAHIDIIDMVEEVSQTYFNRECGIIDNCFRLNLLEAFHIRSYIEKSRYNLLNINKYQSFYYHTYDKVILKKIK
jgi:hypothetical protein